MESEAAVLPVDRTDPRSHVAFHEAGHAVANLLFDFEVESLTIVQDGDALGSVVSDRAGDDAMRYEDDTVKQVHFERRVMVSLAGEIAQRRFDPESVYEGGNLADRRLAADYLDELDTPNQAVLDAYFRLLSLRTEALVERHWARVERIAALLLRQGTATPEEARQAFIDPMVAQLSRF